MMFTHRLFPLILLHAGDITGLDDIARIVTECVALIGQHRGHLDIVKLTTKGLHRCPRNACGDHCHVIGEVAHHDSTAGNVATDTALTLRP